MRNNIALLAAISMIYGTLPQAKAEDNYHGCETTAAKKMFMGEFNRLAEKKDFPSAIDMTDAETLFFDGADGDEKFTLTCTYTVLLDNAKRQKFRLSLQPNSVGEPYVNFKTLGTPY